MIRAGRRPPSAAPVVSTATRNSSGFSTTTARPAGAAVAGSWNLTVTVIAACPGDSRRLRATDGCGGLISTLTATAGSQSSGEPEDGESGSGPVPPPGCPPVSSGASRRYAVDTAAGCPAEAHTVRTTRTGAPAGTPSAQ